jgi:hypothetical protein
MVFHHNSKKTSKAGAMMVIEDQTVAGWVEGWGFTAIDSDGRILRPLNAGLARSLKPRIIYFRR